ncbi:MAG: hypothetical protein QXW19_01725 [Candidatus Bathyarchaeia archaeon]
MSIEGNLSHLKNAMLDLSARFSSQGYEVFAVEPHRASLWTMRRGLFRKVKGLTVDLDDDDWKEVSKRLDEGDYTLGNIFGYKRGDHKFFILVSVDEHKKLALMYSLYLHDEVYEQVKRYRPLLVVFKNKQSNKSFISFINDPSWSKKVEAHDLPEEWFLIDLKRRFGKR